MNYLSCYFQQNNLDFSQLQSATISNIRDTYLDGDTVGGEHLTYIIGELTNPVMFEDHEIVCRSSDEQQCFTSIRIFAEAVIANIEERFPDVVIWSSLKIFDPVSYPTRATQLRGFGKQGMQMLMDHFGKPKVVNNKEYKEVIDPSLFQREWPIFKKSVFDNYRGLSFKELAHEIITKIFLFLLFLSCFS